MTIGHIKASELLRIGDSIRILRKIRVGRKKAYKCFGRRNRFFHTNGEYTIWQESIIT